MLAILGFAVLIGMIFRKWIVPTDPRLGLARTNLVFLLRPVGFVLVCLGVPNWWSDRDYEREGVQTVPIIVGKREVERHDDSGSREYVIDLEYRDSQGQIHRHKLYDYEARPHIAWEKYAVGDRLCPIEYLESKPHQYRFVNNVPWWSLPLAGLGAIAIAQFIRRSAKWLPSQPTVRRCDPLAVGPTCD